MIVIQYIENPKAAISVFDDFSERAQRLSVKLRSSRAKEFLLAERCLSVDIANCTDYRNFEYPSPVRALGALLTQLGRLEIPITES